MILFANVIKNVRTVILCSMNSDQDISFEMLDRSKDSLGLLTGFFIWTSKTWLYGTAFDRTPELFKSVSRILNPV